jgi:hypothetical protein
VVSEFVVSYRILNGLGMMADVDSASCSVAQTFSKVDSTRYTRYMDERLLELDAAAEFPSDSLIVQLVHIQHLSDRLYHLRNREADVDSMPGIPPIPMPTYLAAYEKEWERLRQAIPLDLRDNCESTSFPTKQPSQLGQLADLVSQTYS